SLVNAHHRSPIIVIMVVDGVFFFSSRRRHTRCYRDWSSDVCSSDLTTTQPVNVAELEARFDAGAEITPEALKEKGLIRSTRVDRSEERRVGKECRARWARDH